MKSKLLIYTNSKRVWRTNSRGDYWVLDLLHTRTEETRRRRSPLHHDVRHVFSRRQTRRLRSQEQYLRPGSVDFNITPLTGTAPTRSSTAHSTGSTKRSSSCTTAFAGARTARASPTGSSNSEGVKEFHITNSGNGPYTKIISIRYPKVGEKNSAARIGVVNALPGERPWLDNPTTWLDIPGDPREHYLAKHGVVGRRHRRAAVQSFAKYQSRHARRPQDRQGRHDSYRKRRRLGGKR